MSWAFAVLQGFNSWWGKMSFSLLELLSSGDSLPGCVTHFDDILPVSVATSLVQLDAVDVDAQIWAYAMGHQRLHPLCG
eukprot:1043149-Amphidinium_carterae.2